MLFQYINYEYLKLFNVTKIEGTTEVRENQLKENITKYRRWNFLALFFSFALVF